MSVTDNVPYLARNRLIERIQMTVTALILSCMILSLGKGYTSTDLGVCIAIAVVSVGFFIDISRTKRLSAYTSILIFGLMLRVATLFYDVYTSNPLQLPYVGGELVSDPLGYFMSSVQISQGEPGTYGGFFSVVMGFIFRISIPSRLWGEFIVTLFSMATIVIVIMTLDEVGLSPRQKRIGVCFITFMPNYIFLSVVFRRESLISLIVAASLFWFIRWFHNGRDRYIIAAVAIALLGSIFHAAVSTLAVGYIIVRLLYSTKHSRFEISISSLASTALLLSVFTLVYLNYGDVFFYKFQRVETLSDVSTGVGRGGSTYAQYVGDSSSLASFARYTVPRMAYFMFSPFPWQWRGVADVISFLISSVPYAIILWRASHMVVSHCRHGNASGYDHWRLVTVLLLIILLVIFVYGWGVTNTGTAIRHRDKFIAVFSVLLSSSSFPSLMRESS